MGHRETDPDPIAVLGVCFAGVTMVSGIVVTITRLLETEARRREEMRAERESLAEILVVIDRVIATGQHISKTIDNLQRDGTVALSFSSARNIQGEITRPRFALGESTVSVSGSSREMWNLLVDDACDNVKLINRLVLDYCEQLDLLFEKIRLWQSREVGRWNQLEVRDVMRRAYSLQERFKTFQSLTAKTPLPRAQEVFYNMCQEARMLVQAIDELAITFRYHMR
jgi:hypothetical protein